MSNERHETVAGNVSAKHQFREVAKLIPHEEVSVAEMQQPLQPVTDCHGAALEAYNQSKSKNMPFEVWLELEYKEPRMQTLLEAAETVVTIWKSKLPEGSLTNLWSGIVNLSEVIEREKKKPVRNCDKYNTAKDALDGFNEMCAEKHCDRCQFSAERNECSSCKLNWLYAEAEK